MKQNGTLFNSTEIGNINLKNRFVVAPMTRISATEDGTPTERMLGYYSNFAKGGFGLIITEGTYIDDQYSQTYRYQPGILLEKHIDGWKKITKAIHAQGAKAFMQIQHAGALSQGNFYVKGTVAPSAIQPKGKQLDFYYGNGVYPVPREITASELINIKKSFVTAARNAKKAGFDGVEIHGANGYLLDQFLTNYTNTRIDEYGGSVENRVRLLVEVIKAVKQEVAEDLIVGIRLSQGKVNDYAHKWQGEEEAEFIFRSLENAGADYLHITEFLASAPAFPSNGQQVKDNLSLAGIAKRTTRLPVIVNGQIDSLAMASAIFEHGDADFFAIGKAALANPDFPNRMEKGISLKAFDPVQTLRPTAEIKDFEIAIG